jgi:hypothetical protein
MGDDIALKVYRLGCDTEDSGIQIRFLTGERDISLVHTLQTGSGVRLASSPVAKNIWLRICHNFNNRSLNF